MFVSKNANKKIQIQTLFYNGTADQSSRCTNKNVFKVTKQTETVNINTQKQTIRNKNIIPIVILYFCPILFVTIPSGGRSQNILLGGQIGIDLNFLGLSWVFKLDQTIQFKTNVKQCKYFDTSQFKDMVKLYKFHKTQCNISQQFKIPGPSKI